MVESTAVLSAASSASIMAISVSAAAMTLHSNHFLVCVSMSLVKSRSYGEGVAVAIYFTRTDCGL